MKTKNLYRGGVLAALLFSSLIFFNCGNNSTEEPEQTPTEDKIVKQLNDREYGRVRFVASTAADSLERSQANLAACTKTLDGKIDEFMRLVNQDPNAQTLFNDVNLVKLSGKDYVDGTIIKNNTEMGEMMSAIYRNMDSKNDVAVAMTCNNAITMRSYLESAGNETNKQNVTEDIDSINQFFERNGKSYRYNDFENIESDYNYCLEQAANNAGVNVNVFKAATEVVACKDAIWGFRDKLQDRTAIANTLYDPALPNSTIPLRTIAMVNACLSNYLPSMQ